MNTDVVVGVDWHHNPSRISPPAMLAMLALTYFTLELPVIMRG